MPRYAKNDEAITTEIANHLHANLRMVSKPTQLAEFVVEALVKWTLEVTRSHETIPFVQVAAGSQADHYAQVVRTLAETHVRDLLEEVPVDTFVDDLRDPRSMESFTLQFLGEHRRLFGWTLFVADERRRQRYPASARFLDPTRLAKKYGKKTTAALVEGYIAAHAARAADDDPWAWELVAIDVSWGARASPCMKCLLTAQVAGKGPRGAEHEVAPALIARIFEKRVLAGKKGHWRDEGEDDFATYKLLAALEFCLRRPTGRRPVDIDPARSLAHEEFVLELLHDQAPATRKGSLDNFATKVLRETIQTALRLAAFGKTALGARALRWIDQ